MGSGDLNLLKSWNPKLVRNREKVWVREQELLREAETARQRQREIERERELDGLLESSGTHKQSSLSWMYDTPDVNEDYLLGKKKLDTKVIAKDTKADIPQRKSVKKDNSHLLDKEDPMNAVSKATVSSKKVTKPRTQKVKTDTVSRKRLSKDTSLDY